MTKKFSAHLLAVAFSFLVGISGSGTGHASPLTSIDLNTSESQVEIVEMSHWTKFRDHITGRREREKERERLESARYDDDERYGDDYYRQPPPPPPTHRPHHHFPHHRR